MIDPGMACIHPPGRVDLHHVEAGLQVRLMCAEPKLSRGAKTVLLFLIHKFGCAGKVVERIYRLE